MESRVESAVPGYLRPEGGDYVLSGGGQVSHRAAECRDSQAPVHAA